MKTFMIVVGILAITAVVYGFDPKRLQKFRNNFENCTTKYQHLSTTDNPTVPVLNCMLIEDGRIFDANGEFMKEEVLKAIEDVIPDANKMGQALTMYNNCYDRVIREGGTDEKQKMKIITCIVLVMPFIETDASDIEHTIP
ncbi:uncharacterized protein LOC112588367 [Harpegnathos saltator]|nr:uncharacterized protein LOC112588367 [Harpegnathos saltator]